jgi:hypothetical protein
LNATKLMGWARGNLAQMILRAEKGSATMKIRLERSGKVLKVHFGDIGLAQEHLEGGPFRRRYRSSRGVTFTFEKSAKVFFLCVSFDSYKDARVLSRISSGRPVAELQMLSKLAHLPCAKIYVSEVRLPDGRNVDLIDTVKFELQKVVNNVWASWWIESEVDGLRRQMKLNSLKDRLPGSYPEWGPDTAAASQAGSARNEVIFAHRVKELNPETEVPENCRKGKEPKTELAPEAKEHKEAAPERRFDPEKRPVSPPMEAAPQIDAPIVPEDRDPSEIAECDGCEELCYERELIEVKPGLHVCVSCADDDDTLRRLGLTPDEMDSFWRLMRCDWCGQPLTEVEPGRWLCPGCSLEKEVSPLPPTEQGPEVVVIESRLKDGAVRFDPLKVKGMRWLETRVDIPVGPGKVIPAGKWIIGTSAADGWRIGAEYSGAVECIWRERDRAGFDKGNIVKVDVEPSIIVPESVVIPGGMCFPASLKRRPILSKDDLTSEFKKPTATDINKAIQLLLWRCRDAEIHKDKPQGKGGFYGLDDWIAKANDDMIRELGLWCADIQELNIGTRDS